MIAFSEGRTVNLRGTKDCAPECEFHDSRQSHDLTRAKKILPFREHFARPLVCHSVRPKSRTLGFEGVFHMFNPKTGWCDSPDHVRPGASRREFLYVGMIGGLGLTL